ncbi:MAG: PEP/pyruvate-binding domain-containing protein [Thermodesulfobacteriota bacterium]
MSLFSFLGSKKSCRLLADSGDEASARYGHFRELLSHNDAVLDAMAALEQTYYGGEPFTPGAARQAVMAMGRSVEGMASALGHLAGGRHSALLDALARILPEALGALDAPVWDASGPPALRLDAYPPPRSATDDPDHPLAVDFHAGDLPDWPRLAGGKAANLARIKSRTALAVPDGFVLTTAAFAAFMTGTGLAEIAATGLEDASPLELADLEARCRRIRDAILAAPLPEAVRAALGRELAALAGRAGGQPLLAVRSSAVGEDGEAAFAGQYESVLNVPFEEAENAVRRVFASKYTPRAVLYRLRNGLDDADAPMAALILPMVSSRLSGVLYTLDPASPGRGLMRLDAVEGLGDGLVSGEAAPFSLAMPRESLAADVPSGSPVTPSLALEIARAGLALEELFGSPQDVEWCVSEAELAIVQSRPVDLAGSARARPEPDLSGRRALVSGGVAASPGAASGEVLRVEGAVPTSLPEGAVVVARNASPDLAALLDRAGAVVTELGGAASHLASVAREMGIPALFGAKGCLGALETGAVVTVDATGARVFEGRVEELLTARSAAPSRLIDSPMHRRLRAALDLVSPLTLKDPQAANFTPTGCETLHDITRFAHETGMREMFGLSGAAQGSAPAVRLRAAVPLQIYCMDLGGGLRESITDCDHAVPADIRSVPMQALWRGFTHPGITWSGTVAFDPRSFLTLLATSATAEVDGGQPGGDSYALLGRDYLNLSARFGYHFANIDAYAGSKASGNHVTLRFGGGAGGFSGKSLRVAFLAGVLSRLGFTAQASGDVLDASLKGAPTGETLDALDQLGRLMASSRLLDMAIGGPEEARSMAEAFLAGDYDLLSKRPASPLPGFHLTLGDWERIEEDGRALARQDGSKWATGLSKGLAGLLGRMAGQRYQKFLDSIEAYFHFPLAVAKDSMMGEGRARVLVRPIDGAIDRAGGLAFAVQSAGTYLTLRINALEDNLMLFRFTDGRRQELASAHLPVKAGEWRELAVEVAGAAVTCLVDGKPYIVHHFSEPPRGFLGLWTKADSVTDFTGLEREEPGGARRMFPA